MKIYEFNRKQKVNAGISRAWEFFSSPSNLKLITPPYMGFEIKSEIEGEMYAGQIIAYTVRPVLNLPSTWVTEITQVEKYNYFIDEQRFGPYKFWHHKHFFRETEDGTEIEDFVHFAIPFGFLGRLVAGKLVRRKLKEIFDFRFQKINEIFNDG